MVKVTGLHVIGDEKVEADSLKIEYPYKLALYLLFL